MIGSQAAQHYYRNDPPARQEGQVDGITQHDAMLGGTSGKQTCGSRHVPCMAGIEASRHDVCSTLRHKNPGTWRSCRFSSPSPNTVFGTSLPSGRNITCAVVRPRTIMASQVPSFWGFLQDNIAYSRAWHPHDGTAVECCMSMRP